MTCLACHSAETEEDGKADPVHEACDPKTNNGTETVCQNGGCLELELGWRRKSILLKLELIFVFFQDGLRYRGCESNLNTIMEAATRCPNNTLSGVTFARGCLNMNVTKTAEATPTPLHETTSVDARICFCDTEENEESTETEAIPCNANCLSACGVTCKAEEICWAQDEDRCVDENHKCSGESRIETSVAMILLGIIFVYA